MFNWTAALMVGGVVMVAVGWITLWIGVQLWFENRGRHVSAMAVLAVGFAVPIALITGWVEA